MRNASGMPLTIPRNVGVISRRQSPGQRRTCRRTFVATGLEPASSIPRRDRKPGESAVHCILHDRCLSSLRFGLHSVMTNSLAFRIAALLGMLAVAFGAFGAHSLKEILAQNGTVAIWEKAVLYHFIHAVMLLVLASRPPLLLGP